MNKAKTLMVMSGSLAQFFAGAALAAAVKLTYDPSLRAQVSPLGGENCPVVFNAKAPTTPLPNPDQIIIDYRHHRILFSVSADKVQHWSVVRHQDDQDPSYEALVGSTRSNDPDLVEVDRLNSTAFKNAPKDNAWIDVTNGISFSNRLFELYNGGPCFSDYNCFLTVAYLLEANDSLAPPEDSPLRNVNYPYEQAFFDQGFVEVRPPDAGQAQLTIHYELGAKMLKPYHVYLPIPGTDWAFHKVSTGVPRMELKANITPPAGMIARHFSQGADTSKHAVASWYLDRAQRLTGNRALHRELLRKGLALRRREPLLFDELELSQFKRIHQFRMPATSVFSRPRLVKTWLDRVIGSEGIKVLKQYFSVQSLDQAEHLIQYLGDATLFYQFEVEHQLLNPLDLSFENSNFQLGHSKTNGRGLLTATIYSRNDRYLLELSTPPEVTALDNFRIFATILGTLDQMLELKADANP